MTEQLAGYLAAFDDARVRLHALAGPLDAASFNWKPAPGSWSVGECIVHLNVMADGYLPVFRAALGASDAPRAAGPFSYGWASRLFIGVVRPGSRPMPTGPAMRPPASSPTASALEPSATLAALDRTTEAYLEVCRLADGRDLRRLRVRSPFLGLLRLPVGAFLEALGLHALRHTAQAERVAEAPGFPESGRVEGSGDGEYARREPEGERGPITGAPSP